MARLTADWIAIEPDYRLTLETIDAEPEVGIVGYTHAIDLNVMGAAVSDDELCALALALTGFEGDDVTEALNRLYSYARALDTATAALFAAESEDARAGLLESALGSDPEARALWSMTGDAVDAFAAEQGQ